MQLFICIENKMKMLVGNKSVKNKQNEINILPIKYKRESDFRNLVFNNIDLIPTYFSVLQQTLSITEIKLSISC